MLQDRHGNQLCEWCGRTMPDHRLGHGTCGGACEAELSADRVKAADQLLAKLRQERRDARDATLRRRYASQKDRRRAAALDGRCAECRQSNPEPRYVNCSACRAKNLAAVNRCKALAREERKEPLKIGREWRRRHARQTDGTNGTTNAHPEGADTHG